MLASGVRLTRGGDAGLATRVGPDVQTVLGLSMTSTSVGWVILDREGPDAFTLDHDVFDVQSTADSTTPDPSQHAAAARGVQAIATASGHKVGAVQVTWSEGMGAAAADMLKSLADSGFDNVLTIPLNQAAQTWGIEVGHANGHDRTALCILEPGTATVMVVVTGAGSVRTAVTNTRDHASDLVDWLTTIFNKHGWFPESLHLVGARDDLDAVAGPIGEALPIPVFDSVDTQLALARGAALVTVTPAAVRPAQADETPTDKPPSRPDRLWFATHAKKVVVWAAAIAIVGAALSLAAGSALNGESVSAQAADPQAEGASVTSASVQTVPTRISAPPPPVQPLAAAPSPAQVQPLAAAPPPAPVLPLAVEPPPAPPAPPESPQLPAEPLPSAVPAPVSVPVRQQTVSAPPPAAPHAVPAPPIASPPAAPLAAPPPPPEPEEPPTPPDPVQVVMSPLLSALP
jgi:hypothetical protein